MTARQFRSDADEFLAKLFDKRESSYESTENTGNTDTAPCYGPVKNERDLVYNFRIWNSKKHSEPKIIQELELLGESPISLIIDELKCMLKYIRFDNEPDEPMSIFVGDELYGDFPTYLKRWGYESSSLGAEFNLRARDETTKLIDIPVQLNTKYLILHGDCGHVFKAMEIRLKTLQDEVLEFPRNLYTKKFGFLLCSVCRLSKASRAVEDGQFYKVWCQSCFTEFYKLEEPDSKSFTMVNFIG